MLTKDLVPITKFNRGGASEVFETLSTGPKVVVRNNVPVCVMMSPDAYDDLAMQLKEARIALSAYRGTGGLTTLGRMMDDLGVTQEDLDRAEDVEIE